MRASNRVAATRGGPGLREVGGPNPRGRRVGSMRVEATARLQPSDRRLCVPGRRAPIAIDGLDARRAPLPTPERVQGRGIDPSGSHETRAALVDPRPLEPWRNNYGVWVDEFENLGLADCFNNVWQQARVVIEDDKPEGIQLDRAYAQVDRIALKDKLLRRCIDQGVRFGACAVEDVTHEPNGTVVRVKGGKDGAFDGEEVHEVDGDGESAEAAFKKALEVAEPDQLVRAYSFLGSFYYGRDRIDEAIATLEEGIERVEDPLDLIYHVEGGQMNKVPSVAASAFKHLNMPLSWILSH